jgi:ATP-binding cassette subfamily F protein 3
MLKAENLRAGYSGGDDAVRGVSIEVAKGSCVALIGANGKGKSTVLRIIAGTENFSGDRKWGHNVDESFYAQHQLEALNVNASLLEEMQHCGSQKTDLELRSLLGCFLFSGDDIDKKIKVLSGGEKARIALAKTIISKANFLLLDEPTNHLDMHSVELLIEALNKYGGSYILVSHDRHFVANTANKIWEIVDGKIKEFKGTYNEYLEWKERMASKEKQPLNQDTQDSKINKISKPIQQDNNDQRPTTNPPISKEQKKELQKKQKELAQAEEKLDQFRKEKDLLEAQLADPTTYSDKEKFIKTEVDYKKIQEELKMAEARFEEIFEKIIELESNSLNESSP